MLIFIENTPRTYAWGSRDALPALLGIAPNGEPQAELWLGDHPGAPATVAKASPAATTLIDLIESDPEMYGVDGQHLPFLMKLLGIGAPLSLQVHPNKQQAEAGFAREEAAGVPRDAAERSYGDPNHKPEVLVALSEVSALCGFRPLAEARADLLALATAAPAGSGRAAIEHAASLCAVADEESAGEARFALLHWALSGSGEAAEGARAVGVAIAGGGAASGAEDQVLGGVVDAARLRSLRELTGAHPGDPGVLISLLLHLVTLQPGEAVYLGARQLHAYLGGIAVEVMAASDNVLRAGLTVKHVDVDEVMRIVDTSTLGSPRLEPCRVAPGLVAWRPGVPDFCLMRARVGEPASALAYEIDDTDHEGLEPAAGFTGTFDAIDGYEFAEPRARELPERAESVRIDTPYPLVLVVTEGRVRVERVGTEFQEVATAARGQSLYVSAGDAIELSGVADVFLATVGEHWPRVS